MKRFFAILALFFPLAAVADDIYIVLDPGHGGPEDVGMLSNGFNEKENSLLIAKKIQALIETDDKYEVVLTRIGDYPVTPNDRRKIANQYEDVVFVSLHSAQYEKEPKITTYIQKQISTAKQTSILTPIELANSKEYNQSVKLSKMLEDEFPEHLDHEIVISPYPLSNLVGIQAPAILIECQCFPKAEPSKDDGALDDIARTLSDGIQRFARKEL